MKATTFKTVCECDLRHRAWNPNTGRCETCGARFEDRRVGQQRDEAPRSANEEKAS